MKKILVSVLVLLTVLTLCSCTKKSGGYKLVEVPKEMEIEAEVLSEDVDGNILNLDEDYQLICGIPEENLYLYYVYPTIAQGVLVKFDGRIQFLPWQIVPQLAQTELYVADYNQDGKKDIAVSYLESVGVTNHNEALHILLNGDKNLTDVIYSSEKAATDAESKLTVDHISANGYSVSVDDKENTFSMNGKYGDLLGVTCGDIQDFKLGDIITLEINPGLVFKDLQDPLYSVFKYNAEIVLENDTCKQTNSTVKFS